MAEEAGEAVEVLATRRQSMCLFVGNHLQAMLDGAQEPVGILQIGARRSVDPAAVGERAQRHQRLPASQLRISPARDELLGLNEKFDFPDAAPAKLDIVSLDRDDAVTAIGMDLALHLMNVGERDEIEVLAPDERREIVDEQSPAA